MKVKKSKFNLSHEVKLTCAMGDLIPCMCQEVVPGDRWKVRTDMVLRLMPLIAPMMHRVDCYVHYFYVPTRLVWRDFDTYLSGGRDGKQTVVHPYVTASNLVDFGQAQVGSLSDYLGLPVLNLSGAPGDTQFSSLPFRAYQMIYDEWYRDENLIEPIDVPVTNSEDTSRDLFTLRKRAWKKDYFTSALPWAQRGDPVQLPFTGDAPVVTNGNVTRVAMTGSGAPSGGIYTMTSPGTTSSTGAVSARLVETGVNRKDTNLRADLTAASAGITINDLRWAVVVQKFLERNARGIRFIEFLKNHFDVISSDARLQRPEYLGGGKMPIVIGEVLQTSSTDDTSPQGNMAGKGVGASAMPGFSHFFEEQGFVFGILSIMPKASYQQGVSRMWSRLSRYEEFFPEFANLGEQEIKNKELFLGVSGNDDVFGYAPRYQEYRSIPSSVHGEFRSSMSFWHLGRIFENAPVLSEDFIECSPSERVFAVEDESHKCIVDMLHHVQAIRPLPKTANPGVIL